MTWVDLHARVGEHATLSLALLDCALQVVRASRDAWLDASIAAETPSLATLCRMLDACGAPVPDLSANQLCGGGEQAADQPSAAGTAGIAGSVSGASWGV